MLKVYQLQNGGLKGSVVAGDAPIPADALWIDVLTPSSEERAAVNAYLGMELPTRADMEEIEISSRIYSEDGGIFMTALILSHTDSDRPVAGVVTFVLAHEKLITIRYIDPQPFRTFALRCERAHIAVNKAESVLLGLIDVIIDRMADVLERAASEVETISLEIFDPKGSTAPNSRDFQEILRKLGRKHDLTGKTRESLLTIGRVLAFLGPALDTKPNRDVKGHIKTLTRDVQSLQDHSTYLAGKMNYLQDATLGLINIDQNNIIKIMSVAAIIFLPPTLIASIYGMNFRLMPELNWAIGYPIAVVLMVVSAVLPYFWFKRRGWL
ncbi:MAG TPA: magnesium transporter CorA family protein [Rhizomicrobium sp.]|jgi:magnesium transporter|nr:magnesium transporter CorA family protein [Rhizomicrobium sp.]